jgi:cytochrome c peroxidase
VIAGLWFIFALLSLSVGGGKVYRWDLPQGFPPPPVPSSNPMSAAKVRLGRYLFYDTRLSVNGSQSCASCHQQKQAFTDGRSVGVGATGQSHSRSAMSLVNVAYSAVLTWSNPNMRSLEDQAMIPLFGEHPVELGMHGREQELLARLRGVAMYRELFPQAFPGVRDSFSVVNVARALACFERTIISARSAYDRYHTGGEPDAISEAAKRGEADFFTDYEGSCFRCHSGFNFSDAASALFHNTGLYNPYPAPDLGIFEHTHRPEDQGKFKTPTLRNIALTAPYMHDGSIASLEDVIEHYAAGGRTKNPHRDPRMLTIQLTAQNKRDLVAFLRSLTDDDVTRDRRFSKP